MGSRSDNEERQFQRYHRVLNRVKWSSLLLSRILVTMLVATFLAAGMPLIIAAAETIERRTANKIRAKGVFRDPVRSSKKHVIECFGPRWISMMLLVPLLRGLKQLNALTRGSAAPHVAPGDRAG